MSRIERLQAKFVEFIPNVLENGVLYVSRKYKTASHLCCCGCGNKVVTPLKPGGWELTVRRKGVSLYPSIGSWSLPCRSHYWIRGNRVEWAPQWNQEQIAAARVNDQRAREQYYNRKVGLWQRVLDFITELFH